MRNKNNIRKKAGDYQVWLATRDGYDAESLEGLCTADSPYDIKPMAPLLEDVYEELERLYYDGHLKRRQRQIVALLFEGLTDQTEIARRIGMDQRNIPAELKKIMKKISKNIM